MLYEVITDATVTTVNWSVDVIDNIQWSLGSTSDSHTFTYSSEFDCRWANYVDNYWSYQVPNTATIVQTWDNDTALVTVDCYKPVVTKTANPAKHEWYRWEIDKTVDKDHFELFDWQSATWNYT